MKPADFSTSRVRSRSKKAIKDYARDGVREYIVNQMIKHIKKVGMLAPGPEALEQTMTNLREFLGYLEQKGIITVCTLENKREL